MHQLKSSAMSQTPYKSIVRWKPHIHLFHPVPRSQIRTTATSQHCVSQSRDITGIWSVGKCDSPHESRHISFRFSFGDLEELTECVILKPIVMATTVNNSFDYYYATSLNPPDWWCLLTSRGEESHVNWFVGIDTIVCTQKTGGVND